MMDSETISCDSNNWIRSTYKSSNTAQILSDQNCENTQFIKRLELTLKVSRRRKKEQLNLIMQFSSNIPYLMLIRWLCEGDFPKSQKKHLFILLLPPLSKAKQKKKAKIFASQPGASPRFQFSSIWFDFILSEVVLMLTKRNEKCIKTWVNVRHIDQ